MMINILLTSIIAVNEITDTNNNYWISFISLQFIKQYDDEDLMEIVLPRLARVMTVWEFVLMKVCLYIGTAKKYRIWSKNISCNLFQKVKLLYLLDSLHVK